MRSARNHMLGLALTIVAIPCLSLHAATINETAVLRASDGEADDVFGNAVAASGSTAVVGAPADDDNGEHAGAAYVFDLTTGQEVDKLLADDGAAAANFGHDVATADGMAVIGAPKATDDGGLATGAAYMFDLETGDQIARLLADDGAAGDMFGFSVAIGDGLIVVGAKDDAFGGFSMGAAYIFDAETFVQLHKLVPDDPQALLRFGGDVAIGDGLVVVGALGDGTNGASSGAAYVFDAASGDQIDKLTPADGMSGDEFGLSVAMDGSTALISAHSDDNTNGFAAGSAHLFDATSGTELDAFIADDGEAVDLLGWSVALDGDRIGAGAIGEDDNGENSGAAYIFSRATGEQESKLLASDGEANDLFGLAMAFGSGGVVLASAPGDDELGEDAGAVYVFDLGAACPADLSAPPDAMVDATDLFALLAAWGPCPESCPADLNGDDAVDGDDLFELIGAWGPCS